MAAPHYSPLPDGLDDLEDPVTYKEAVALLARTGHPVAESTVRRYVQEDGLDTVRARHSGKAKDYASYSDILQAHFRRTAVKLRTSSNWP